MPVKNIAGQRFGYLVAVEHAACRIGGEAQWRCTCDCGKEKLIAGSRLRNGSARSCGCMRFEFIAIANEKHRGKRGKTKTSEYRSWASMRDRCLTKTCNGYHNYGGRGISICDRWLHSFENFLEDMGPKPASDYEIDRIDVNGNYEPTNCRWLSRKDNQRNKRNSKLIEFNGVARTATEWTELYDLPVGMLSKRIDSGWSPEKALTTPPMVRGLRGKRKAKAA
jgi:hypothetical protein